MAPRCVWLEQDDAILVGVLVKAKKDGKQSDSGFKRDVWNEAAAEVKRQGVNKGAEKTWSKCQDHFGNMKGDFKEVDELVNKSGFGWDDNLKMVQASETLWANELNKYPKYAYWKTHRYLIYNEMFFLVKGIIATGERAFHAGQAPTITNSTPVSADASFSSTATAPSQNPTDLQESQTAAHDADESGSAPPPVEEEDESAEQTSLHSSPPPSTQPRKRQRADSDPPEAVSKSAKRAGGRNFNRNADATRDVADAMRSLASSLAADPSTPRRRREAIELVADDGEYSDGEETQIFKLFSRKKAVADTYLSIQKKSARVNYIRSELFGSQDD